MMQQSNYNMGNALARLGRYHEAIAAYDRTLAEQPDHADATFNRELLEKELERQQEQQQQDQDRQQQQEQQRQQQEQQQGQDQPGTEQQQDNQQAGQEQPQSPQTGDQADSNESSAQDEWEQAQTQQHREQGGQQEREPEQPIARSDDLKTAEEQQAVEQWLRRIPDDPSGLLRRKFRYQYQQRNYERERG